MYLLSGEILKGKYRVERQLGRGGMGCVYLCTNIELGNLWAIKYISKQESNLYSLLAEEEILKKLNHISLPKIVDLFYDETGTYIVESYIEGKTLKEKLVSGERFEEDTVIEWSKQLCECLIYLHNMKPHPIIYGDMKPSNIIITGDNKAVIIDFGISREYRGENSSDTLIAGTCTYAAPEQLTAGCNIDQRTDIYSLGITLYQMLTGVISKYNDSSIRVYNSDVSEELDFIISKCIWNNIEERYQSVEELKSELDNIRELKAQNRKASLINKLLIAGVIVLSLVSYSMSFLGIWQINREKTAILDVNPKILVMTEQQTGQILVERIFINGHKQSLKNERVEWISADEKVAKIEDGKVLAMNEGETQITGRFGNKAVQLEVKVGKRLNDYINVNLRYNKGYSVENFAGNGQREAKDGELKQAGFFRPTSMTMVSNGTIFVIDSNIRKIHNGRVETIDAIPDYIEPKIIRSNAGDEIFIASREWINTNEEYKIGIFKLVNNSLKPVFEDNGDMFSFKDFAFDDLGNMYVLENDVINDVSRLIKVNLTNNTRDLLKDDLDGIDCITVNKNNDVYLSGAKYGTICKWQKDKKKIIYVAGLHNQKHFIDGKDNRFFAPGRIFAYGTSLYVIDYNLVRKLNIIDEKVIDTETIAGQVSGQSQSIANGPGVESVFNTDYSNDIIVDSNGNIYITDSQNNTIRKIYRNGTEATSIFAQSVEKFSHLDRREIT